MNLTTSQLRGLLRLLDEEDRRTRERLLVQLGGLDAGAVEQLTTLADDASPVVQRNIRALTLRLRRDELTRGWMELLAAPRVDLEAGMMLIARAELGPACPEPKVIADTLDTIAASVALKLSTPRSNESDLAALTEVLSGQYGLTGNEANYYDPRNSLLPEVLERGFGIPISLCCVAILVGKRVGIPVYGLNTPGHFLGFVGNRRNAKDAAVFDPFNAFQPLQGKDRAALDKHLAPEACVAASARDILVRTLRNLISIHERRAEIDQAEFFAALLTRAGLGIREDHIS